jgi:NADH-quinone oxidoreductase subunit H
VIRENEYGIIYILVISSISVYILLYSGWASNSNYTFIGTVRAIAQLISYEVSIGIIIMSVVILADSLNISKIEYSQIYTPLILPLFPIFILFIISSIAETNRPPFDLPEAESELVAGILTEYGGFAFAYLYLAEYTFLLSMSVLTSILFLGTFLLTPLFVFIFIWVRTSLPRVRYDQLMNLG